MNLLKDNRLLSDSSSNYKSVSGLISQTTVSQTSGVLIADEKLYVIYTLNPGDDFANVGFTGVGIPFLATRTTPTSWIAGTEVINLTDSAPELIILDNDLSELSTLYSSVGNYTIEANPKTFTINKTWTMLAPIGEGELMQRLTDDQIAIQTGTDGSLNETSFEIRVYN